MAATTLTQASEDEILKIFKVVAKKTITSVDGMVQVTKPKLNTLIAETIDSFRKAPQQVDKTMNTLIARMRELGMNVDDLTKDMKKMPKGFESLTNALRAKEQDQLKAEKSVQDLRDKGIAAQVIDRKVHLITSKEMRENEKKWTKEHKRIVSENQKLQERTEKLKNLSVVDRAKEEKKIIEKREEIIKDEEKLEKDQKQKKGEVTEAIQGENQMFDSEGIFAPMVDTFMGIKDSIIGPFEQIGGIAKRIGKSFLNFGKSMLTPIKSLKRFGVSLMLALVPMLPWALLLIVLVAVVAMIIFKFKAIAKAVGEWWDGFKITLGEWWEGVKNIATTIKEWILNIPTMLGEALDSAYDFISGIGGRIWDALGDALTAAKDFIIDGFHSMINGMINMVNSWLPKKWEIPLIGKEGATPSTSATEDEKTEGKKFMQNQWNSVDEGVKGSLKIEDADRKAFVEGKFKEQIAPTGTKAVIVQDNKTINNSQSNAESVMVAKANKNPEPASKWENLNEFSGS